MKLSTNYQIVTVGGSVIKAEYDTGRTYIMGEANGKSVWLEIKRYRVKREPKNKEVTV